VRQFSVVEVTELMNQLKPQPQGEHRTSFK